MARWIKMPLGRKVGLDPRDIVLDGDSAPPPPKWGTACNFRPMLWPNGCMDQDATWYEGRPRTRPHCGKWEPSSLSRAQPPPNFRPMPIVVKRSPILATAEHLFTFI